MESVIVSRAQAAYSAENSQAATQQMPLTFLRAGEEARILKVRSNDELHHHLENLGFVPGASLRVVSEYGGSVIIEIKGAQIALDKAAASKIITS